MNFSKFLLIFASLINFFGIPVQAASHHVDDERFALLHNGVKRTYLLRLPEGFKADSPCMPLVLVLHGGGGNADNAEQMTGFTELARKQGFIVVYPEGSGRFNGKLLTWNAGHCCGYAMRQGVDDVGFIAALIDKLVAEQRVDPKRVYVTGMSNGGMMTHRLGIELSNRIAAIAPVVATLFGDERKPAMPVPALIVNGLLDKSVPPSGGPPGGLFTQAWEGMARPFAEQGAFWAAANGCGSEAKLSEDDRYALREYPCPAGNEVLSYLVKDSGHAWPGGQRGSRMGDTPGTAINATESIWRFFANHRKAS